MPLRFLQYVARLYKQIQNPRDRYFRRLKKIPTPEFYVFYNGEEAYPEQATLKLSDAFMTSPVQSSLELVVSVININYNKGSEILYTCKPLKETRHFSVSFNRSALRAKGDERLTLNRTYVHLSFIKLSIGGVKTSGNGFEFSEAFLF